MTMDTQSTPAATAATYPPEAPMTLQELVPSLFANDLDWADENVVSLAIPEGTLVEYDDAGRAYHFRLRGNVYAAGRREVGGCWIYVAGEGRYRVDGGSAQALETLGSAA